VSVSVKDVLKMITIFIENRPYTVKEGRNLLQACLSLGFDIPYFCWHPAMHSVGACRQCAVKEFKDEKDTRGRIIMSCMTGVKDGMRISIDDAEAKSFRKSIVELLMLNHPHDCPVCDEGSECHLQDMTVMTGHVYRKSRFRKRTYPNQYLGPFLSHEMNRCIQCYRCVRFYRDYAGGRDLDVFAVHDAVYFGRHKDGVLANPFCGNLVEICPTGVFTDKTFRKHYTRKWDLQTAPSVCVHCGVGCNTIPGERYGKLRRIRCRYNGEVNRYFLCDRGRFGYGFVNSGKRIRQPFIKSPSPTPPARGGETVTPSPLAGEGWGEGVQAVSREAAVNHIKEILSRSKGIIGIGSPRASLESNFALRTLVGPENFYSGMSDRHSDLVSLVLNILKNGPARSPSLREIESSDAVLVLGEDVTNTAPVLALALRQAARQKARETAGRQKIPLWDDAAVRNATQGLQGVFYTATPYGTGLDDLAVQACHAAPDDLARLGYAVAHELNKDLPAVPGLDEKSHSLAASIARDLRNARRPLIVSGIGCGSREVIHAAANVAWALCGGERTAWLSFAVPECNTMGLGMMAPEPLGGVFRAAREGGADTAIILENDIFLRSDEATVNRFFEGIRHVIVIDHLETPTSVRATVALPAATFAEADGTLVNCEGRAQRFYQVLSSGSDIQESWRWLRDIMKAAGRPGAEQWEGLDHIGAALAGSMPVFGVISEIAPPAGFRIAGMKIPRQPQQYSGRTALSADRTVFEPRPPKDPDSALAFTMEGYPGQPPSALIPRFWAPGWNSPQAINKFQDEVGGPLRGGDPGKRLIEANESPAFPVAEVPAAFAARINEVLCVNAYHVFGSEELSMLAPGIAGLSPGPYVGLNPQLMKDHDLTERSLLRVTVNNTTVQLPAKQVPGLPEGMAALPAGLVAAGDLPAWGTLIEPDKRHEVVP
jgi:NADH-quinone oxidoreductase subunit G